MQPANIWSGHLINDHGTPLHIKVVMELLIPLMIAHDFLADVCSADKICRIMVKISGPASSQVGLCSKPLITTVYQLVCYQGDHSVVN